MRLSDIRRKSHIYAVKTSIAHEKGVAEMIYHRLNSMKPRPSIKSILVIDQLRGYIFIEALHQRDVMMVTSNMMHVKGKSIGLINIEELDKFLVPEPMTQSLSVGDQVEIISGVFTGQKAIVTGIDTAKNDVTVMLIENNTGIPITLDADFVKIIEKGPGYRDDFEEGEISGRRKGIKEFTFDGSSTPPSEVESFSDDFESATPDIEESQAPEVTIYSGHKGQRLVEEKFDLNVDDEDYDDFEDEFEDDFEDESLDYLDDVESKEADDAEDLEPYVDADFDD
ncbi:MAG: transcription elongation factor Spt5, partial [Promethearchaeota archaeon]